MDEVDLSAYQVLIVEDSSHMQGILWTMLSDMGVGQIYMSSSGENAIEILKTKPIDVILTDYMMEGMDGIDLTRAVRASSDPITQALPVIMISAFSEMIESARDAGITEFLTKPTSAEKVRSRILASIKKPRQFVSSEGFKGPDRRRNRGKPTGTWDGIDRRGKG